MKIVRPIALTDASLLSTNVVDDAVYAAWAVGTTYGLGAIVYYSVANSHRRYQSLVAGNIGHIPIGDSVNWTDVGSDTKWAMFDSTSGSQSTNANSVIVSIQPSGRVDTIGLLNLNGTQAIVSITDAVDGVVYNQTLSLINTAGISDLFAYMFEPITYLTDLVLTGLPIYYNPTIGIEVDAAGATAAIGNCVVGQAKDIGATQYGATVGIQDFSVKSADAFGNYNIVQRAFSKIGSFTVWAANTLADQLESLLAQYRATPILYIGSDAYASTAIYGFFKDFSIAIQYPTYAICTIDIEGL